MTKPLADYWTRSTATLQHRLLARGFCEKIGSRLSWDDDHALGLIFGEIVRIMSIGVSSPEAWRSAADCVRVIANRLDRPAENQAWVRSRLDMVQVELDDLQRKLNELRGEEREPL